MVVKYSTMKKYLSFAAISLVISALAVVSCNKESELVLDPEQQEVELIFTSEKPDLFDATRTVYHASDKSIYWSSSDKIRVAIKVGENWQTNTGNADPSNEEYAKLYESNQAGSESRIVDFKVPTNFAPTTTGNYEFYAFYPHSLVSSANANQYMPSVQITIPDEQTPPIGSFDPGADVMTAVSVGEYTGIPEDRVVLLDWTRQVAHGDITLKNLPSFDSDEIFRSISIIAQEGADLAGYHYLNMTTGAITLPSNSTPINAITVLAKEGNLNVNSDGKINFWFSSLPFTATSLKVVITTNKYTYTKEYTNISKEFKKNSRNILSISMSNAVREDAGEQQLIENGTYAIHTTFTDNQDYMMVASSGSKQASSVYSTTAGLNGSLMVPGSAAWIFTYDEDNNVYYIQNAETETYLSGTAGGTDLKLVDANNKVGFSASEVTGGFHLSRSNSTNTRWIGTNTSSDNVIFGMYNNDSSYPGILQLTPVTVDLVPSITFTITEKDVNSSATTVEFPFVAKHLTGAISTSIKNGSDDIIAENGIAVGTDKITVTLKPNDESTTKSATIIVSSSGVDDQELVINQMGKPEGGYAPLNTVLFSEAFSGFSASDVPTSSNSETVVYGGGTLVYACTGSTKIFTSQIAAGGTSPEILVNGSFKITGIPTGGAKKITLSYKSNKATGTLKLTVAGGTIGTITNSDKTYTGTITPSSGAIDLTFSASTNSRLDDIVLTVSEAGSSTPSKTLSSISVTPPTKTTYNVGDSFDATGMVVTATYSDATTADVTSSVTTDFTTQVASAGNKTVTVSYTENNVTKTGTFGITVNDATGGNPVVFIAGTDTGATSVTKNGITISMTTMNESVYKTYKSTDMTVSAESGKTIISITLTSTNEGQEKYGPGCFSLLNGQPGSYSYEGNVGTWSGSAQNVSLYASLNQVRMTRIEVAFQ